MNRRQAIFRITLAGTAATTAVSGYKWYEITKTPDLFVLDKQRDLIAALAETIIPATDTPGAKDAGVHDFIIMMIKECTGRKEQNKFINGLQDLQGHCLANYGRPYQQCPLKDQESVLWIFEKKGKPFNGILGKVQNKFLGRSFFTTLKQYTVEGYCTSQPGATKGLAYVSVPGGYQGCIPLTKNQKGWATN
jgi:hypothetical protein